MRISLKQCYEKCCFNPFMHGVLKWPNILQKSCSAKFLKCVWPFYNMHERVKHVFWQAKWYCANVFSNQTFKNLIGFSQLVVLTELVLAIAKPIRLLETFLSVQSNCFMKKGFAMKYFSLDDGFFLKQSVCFDISFCSIFQYVYKFHKSSHSI